MSSVTFPTDLGGDGSTVTDDNNPTTGLDDGGHIYRFVPALAQAVVMARTAADKAAIAKASADSAVEARLLAEAAAAEAAAINLAVPTAQPFIRPSLLLDFANSETVDVRITFSRASSALSTNRNGLLESVVANAPRIEYDRLTGRCLGLLIEGARTNQLTYSSDASDASWSKNSGSTATAPITAPDGTTSAYMITSADEAGIQKNSAAIIGTVYCQSIFIKLATGTCTSLRLRDPQGSSHEIIIDAQTGTISGQSNVISSGADFYTNNWCRVWMTYQADTTSTMCNIRPHNQAGSTTFYVWGAQIEVGDLPSTYIPTTSSSVTRSADVASMTCSDFSAWFRSGEGTMIVNGIKPYSVSGSMGIYRMDDGTDSNRVMARASGSGGLEFRVISADVGAATLDSGNALAVSAEFSHAGSYKANSFLSAFNGGNALSDVSGAVPVGINRILIGETAGNGTIFMFGVISLLAFYPKQLTSTENLAMTTL